VTPVELSLSRARGSLAVVLLGGVAISLATFCITSLSRSYVYIGPLGHQEVRSPGFDLWTGEPYGRIFDRLDIDTSKVERVTADVPAELTGRRAVPLPLGFVLGAILTMLALMATSTTGSRGERDSLESRS